MTTQRSQQNTLCPHKQIMDIIHVSMCLKKRVHILTMTGCYLYWEVWVDAALCVLCQWDPDMSLLSHYNHIKVSWNVIQAFRLPCSVAGCLQPFDTSSWCKLRWQTSYVSWFSGFLSLHFGPQMATHIVGQYTTDVWPVNSMSDFWEHDIHSKRISCREPFLKNIEKLLLAE